MSITEEQSAKLRAPFPAEQIGKKPQYTCRVCAKAPGKVCDQHSKAKCRVCDNYCTTAHMHLDFVGHAHVTDRLLSVDPGWFWEPLALDADGLPRFDRHGGLWIRLTVNGTSRIGYGDGQGKDGADAVKETIGDAIKNAAMRFGVALDLWAKTPLSDPDESENHNAPAARQERPTNGQQSNGEQSRPTRAQRASSAVSALTSAATVKAATDLVGHVEKSDVRDFNVIPMLRPEQREAVGVTGDTCSLHGFALLVKAWVVKHECAVNDAMKEAAA